jgi:hypothetical protein
MRPSLFNYALAHTCEFSMATGIFRALAFLFTSIMPLQTVGMNWSVALWATLAAIPTAGIGWMAGVFMIWPVAGRVAGALQGAPFHVGDPVWVLVGKYKDTLTRVYEVWDERGQVRVELGAKEREDVTDVFCIVAICRDRSTGSLADKT